MYMYAYIYIHKYASPEKNKRSPSDSLPDMLATSRACNKLCSPSRAH